MPAMNFTDVGALNELKRIWKRKLVFMDTHIAMRMFTWTKREGGTVEPAIGKEKCSIAEKMVFRHEFSTI